MLASVKRQANLGMAKADRRSVAEAVSKAGSLLLASVKVNLRRRGPWSRWFEAVWFWALFAFGVPIAVFVLGRAVHWAVSGFRA